MKVVGFTSAPRAVAGFDRVLPVSDFIKTLPEVDRPRAA